LIFLFMSFCSDGASRISKYRMQALRNGKLVTEALIATRASLAEKSRSSTVANFACQPRQIRKPAAALHASKITVVAVNRLIVLNANLSRAADIPAAARAIMDKCEHVDVLVHSAGAGFPLRRTVDESGLELAFRVQYLPRFHLTTVLLDHLKRSESPKVLFVDGGGQSRVPLDFGDLQGEKKYSLFANIAKASALNDCMTHSFMRRYPDITFYNYGPGFVRTKLSMPNVLMRVVFKTIGRPFTSSPEVAAHDMHALLSSNRASGYYARGLKQVQPSKQVVNDQACEKLWELSQRLMS
jgi:NAD(P)-dependent dehydrogenase (short-subunit alcohol dehydrogenase family)